MSHHNGQSPSAPIDRLVQALGDPDRLFTQDQVVFLMATAQRWAHEARDEEDRPDELTWRAGVAYGYRQRVAEESADYPPPPFLVAQGARIGADQAAARAAAAADRTQRYAGGPVPVWPAERPDHVPDPAVSTRFVRTREGLAWRDGA